MTVGEGEDPVRPSRPLEGEDLETTRWEDARHWMSIYADLLEFKRGILGRVKRDLSNLLPLAQKAAAADLEIIEAQMRGYEARLDLWYRRLWDLHGLWLDPAGRMVRHKGREAALTKREFQLLQFLLDHPYRYYTAPADPEPGMGRTGPVSRRGTQLRAPPPHDPQRPGNPG